LKSASNRRDAKWTQSIAVRDEEFVIQTKAKLGAKAMGRKAFENNEDYVLKEFQNHYSRVFNPQKCTLRPKNDYFWQASSYSKIAWSDKRWTKDEKMKPRDSFWPRASVAARG
jgi:hypothetical protein